MSIGNANTVIDFARVKKGNLCLLTFKIKILLKQLD